MPNPNEIERQDQENAITDKYLEAVHTAARTRLQVVGLERTLAALHTQLTQEEAACEGLLQELRGIRPVEEVQYKWGRLPADVLRSS